MLRRVSTRYGLCVNTSPELPVNTKDSQKVLDGVISLGLLRETDFEVLTRNLKQPARSPLIYTAQGLRTSPKVTTVPLNQPINPRRPSSFSSCSGSDSGSKESFQLSELVTFVRSHHNSLDHHGRIMKPADWPGQVRTRQAFSYANQSVLILDQNSSPCAADKCDALTGLLQRSLAVRCIQERCGNQLPHQISSVPDLVLVRSQPVKQLLS